MIKYRKNSNWGTKSFIETDFDDIDKNIFFKSEEIQKQFPDKDIDIVDIIINPMITHETEYEASKEEFQVTILYAIVEQKEKREF